MIEPVPIFSAMLYAVSAAAMRPEAKASGTSGKKTVIGHQAA
jgi:hypothetical protein